ncbi:hypothetical protein IPH67_04745 [bacterium]|nr:MAG: hypothetical protein IPH67_04745 [bacterium]
MIAAIFCLNVGKLCADFVDRLLPIWQSCFSSCLKQLLCNAGCGVARYTADRQSSGQARAQAIANGAPETTDYSSKHTE